MKFNIRKISAIGASILMTGLTLGTAMAANYPAPFVVGSTANAAIVWGSGTGVSTLDNTAALAIQADLGEDLPATGTMGFVGGDVFTLEKDSDLFNFAEQLNGVHTTVTSDDMPTFLADGTYDDGSIDEEYEQKITLGTNALSYFSDNDYNDDTPTIGFKFTNGQTILTYEIEFDSAIAASDMNETDMPLMGREYYVLTADANGIVLLDTAERHTLTYGESVTVGDHVVEIGAINADWVKFTVDGESLDKTYEDSTDGDKYQELSDDSIIVLVSNLYDSKEAGISKVEFALGEGKIDLMTGTEAELNDEDIDGLDVTITGGETLTKIELIWTSDKDSFLTEANAIILPTFENIKLGFGGLDFADAEEEVITVDNGEVLTIAMDNYDLELMYFDGTQTFVGADGYNLTLATEANSTVYHSLYDNTTAWSGGIDVVVSDRFLITTLTDDVTDIKTAYYEVTSIDYTDDSDFKVELDPLIGSGTLTFDDLSDTEEVEAGDISIHLVGVTTDYAYFNFSVGVGTISYNTAISDKGLTITLPTAVTIVDTDSLAHINFTEADKDDNIGDGVIWGAVIKLTSDNNLHVSSDNVTKQDVTSDLDVGYVGSDLATMVELDTSATENDYTITYWAEEISGDVYVASADAEIVSEGIAQIMVVLDTEVASVASKNLIVVGGSCINSAAASLVGGAHCGAAWTTATGVGTGQFLIKAYTSGIAGNDFALLVAGYETVDTTNAATFLRTKINFDTSVGGIGTTSTAALTSFA